MAVVELIRGKKTKSECLCGLLSHSSLTHPGEFDNSMTSKLLGAARLGANHGVGVGGRDESD